MLKYGSLPRTPEYGVAIFCPEGHDEGYSASRGDYFMCADGAPVKCGTCDSPMFLGRRVTTIEPVRTS